MDPAARQRELGQLLDRARQIENEIEADLQGPWRPTQFYTAYYATAGFMLGIFGSMVSLLANVIGAPIAGKRPLELIQIYLTFPLGEKAMELGGAGPAATVLPDGLILSFGCCLYLATGMLLGMPFHIALARFAGSASLVKRLIVASGLSLLVWIVNFYFILSWLQPLLPPWVAALTHLIYGWTMAVVYPLGRFTPYRTPQEAEAEATGA